MVLWGYNFTHNRAREGGALFSFFSYARAQCNHFVDNTAKGGGGAVFLMSSTMELSGDAFSANAAGSMEARSAF